MPDIFVAAQKNQKSAPKKEFSDEKPVVGVDPHEDRSRSVHLFTSYLENPDDISFENQDEGENVLLFIRRDFITNVPWIIAGLFFVLLPVLTTPFLLFFHIQPFFLPQKFVLIGLLFYYLLVVSYFFINFITWYFNIDLVTEKRVIDVDLEGLVYKNISATKISLVQDVSYSQVGVIRTVFDYGDVLVQTAGTIDNFIFSSVPRPEDAVHVIENLIGKKNE